MIEKFGLRDVRTKANLVGVTTSKSFDAGGRLADGRGATADASVHLKCASGEGNRSQAHHIGARVGEADHASWQSEARVIAVDVSELFSSEADNFEKHWQCFDWSTFLVRPDTLTPHEAEL